LNTARLPRSGLAIWLDATALPIAVIAAAVSASAFVLSGEPPHQAAVILAAAGAFLIYLVDRAWVFSPEDVTNRPGRLQWHARHPGYRWGAAVVALGLAGAAWLYSPTEVRWMAVGLGSVALIHVTSIGGRRGKARPVLKIAMIAMAWGLGSALLPLMTTWAHIGGELSLFSRPMSLVAVAAARAMVVGANVLVSDVHDIDGDAAVGIRSTSAALGKDRARWAAVGILLAATAIAGSMILYTGSYLWAIEGVGMVVFALVIHPGRAHLPSALSLDLLVGWPLITLLAWAIL
jgi:putative flippase GtrA